MGGGRQMFPTNRLGPGPPRSGAGDAVRGRIDGLWIHRLPAGLLGKLLQRRDPGQAGPQLLDQLIAGTGVDAVHRHQGALEVGDLGHRHQRQVLRPRPAGTFAHVAAGRVADAGAIALSAVLDMLSAAELAGAEHRLAAEDAPPGLLLLELPCPLPGHGLTILICLLLGHVPPHSQVSVANSSSRKGRDAVREHTPNGGGTSAPEQPSLNFTWFAESSTAGVLAESICAQKPLTRVMSLS